MDWMQLLTFFSMFGCLGMTHQHQQQELTTRDKFNISFALMLWHTRCFTVIERVEWGSEALGFPCLYALGLMMAWYLCTADPGMLIWISAWLCMLAVRRIEAVKLTSQDVVPSHSEGYSKTAMKWTKSYWTAICVVEPIMCGLLGASAFWFYQENGWRPTGLPYFLLTGIVTLPAVAFVRKTAWERQIQAFKDGRHVQNALVQETLKQYGRK